MGDTLRQLSEDPQVDHQEIQEWVDALADLKARYGAERAALILAYLQERAFQEGIDDRCEVAPVSTELHEIGSYRAFDDAD